MLTVSWLYEQLLVYGQEFYLWGGWEGDTYDEIVDIKRNICMCLYVYISILMSSLKSETV